MPKETLQNMNADELLVAEEILMICHFLVLRTTEAERGCTYKGFSNLRSPDYELKRNDHEYDLRY